ncbi:MAG TPA: metal ABC transporter substrate-binding protein [Gemmataceae bacterium]|nr:metal ABC transporter substrate-binding protein [Gemmataceae bacterium]
MVKRNIMGACLIVAALALASGLPGCARSTPVWNNHPGGPPRVVVTIPALDNFVRNVGGKHVAVVCLCTTQGPHHYQYDAEDAMLLRQADLFFAIGLTLDEKFADPIQIESHNAHLQYVKLGERLPKKLLLANREEHEHEHGKEEEGHEHGHDHEHGANDPHVWLGIEQAKAMVEIIRDELKKADPKHEADYDKNAKSYLKQLDKLLAYGKKQLEGKKDRKIIAFHESLGYFAKSFDLNIVDVIEVAPGSEAAGPHLTKLADKCKKENVRVIAVEPQYPQESSAKVLKEHNKDLELVVVDPLETADKNDLAKDGKELQNQDWYDKKMKQNLDNLAKALR